MAGSSLLALIDDIASILDDVAAMSKVAAKKTAGMLGDDLALNAYQVAGVRTERELPVVWAVAKGSFKNKLILVPAALAVSAFVPSAITPLLMLGGVYLCFEGCEKLAHRFLRPLDDSAEREEHLKALAGAPVDLVALERDKIRGAVRTDFILSAEIVVIALGTVADAPFAKQVAVLCAIALLMTVGVYGLVAGIVRIDDLGLRLQQNSGAGIGRRWQRAAGALLVAAAPYLMKGLSIVGTVAMFMVGGGILAHGIPRAHDWVERAADGAGALAGVGALLEIIVPPLFDILVGIVAGALALLAVSLTGRYFSRLTLAG